MGGLDPCHDDFFICPDALDLLSNMHSVARAVDIFTEADGGAHDQFITKKNQLPRRPFG